MSGSGSVIFGLFEDREVAERAREYFTRKGILAYS
jgi:4-diphosphocytidyl-2C-methyl-D-erythritol kinase